MTDVIGPPVGFVEMDDETGCGRGACGVADEMGCSGMVVLPVGDVDCGAVVLATAAGAGVLAPASLLSLRLKIMAASPVIPRGSRNTAPDARACGRRPWRRAPPSRW